MGAASITGANDPSSNAQTITAQQMACLLYLRSRAGLDLFVMMLSSLCLAPEEALPHQKCTMVSVKLAVLRAPSTRTTMR
ncbi:hypothetical protein D3C72_1646330 [compost metagenome]